MCLYDDISVFPLLIQINKRIPTFLAIQVWVVINRISNYYFLFDEWLFHNGLVELLPPCFLS